MTDEQVISRVRDTLRLLEQLRTAGAAELLDRVKASEPNPPSFVFQSHDGSGSRTNVRFDQELPMQLPLATSLNDYFPWFVASLNEPPVDTINPALLSIPEAGNTPQSNHSPSIVIDTNMSVPEAESTLFVSHANPIVAGPGSPCGEQALPDGDTDFPPAPLEVSSNKNLQPVSNSELVMGLSTPPSDSPSPATQIPKKNNRCRLGSKQSKITKVTPTDMKKSLTKRSQVGKQPGSAGLEESGVMTSSSLARNALCGLSDPDLQRALEVGEGLIRDGLANYQGSCIWQENGFWPEDALNLSILTDSSAEEKFCHVFRYANTLVNRSSDQKLRLRISHAILYLSFESLTQKRRSGIHSRRLENHDQHRASTLSADYLLRRSYPDKWDLMDDQMKQALRRQFHEQKRQGSRCWRMAGVLGLGALVACGNTLAGVIKNHSKYPLLKLDAVINYIVNVHPDVICLYHEFDAMAKQILLGEIITVRPTRQIIHDRICRAAATKLTPQQAEENWQQIDPASVSQKLIKEFVADYL
ncbi:hypothetical protein GX51_06542 [Blastomyces parvus]|uniref:Uncharacterized protein n=1 Tax=Blastomyces parvus TaxID=2060905 RepID=A0A2B7WQ55_9EURO|nr:hypothetical protein GX51_06542 [Blastomyces parvus]